MTGFKGIFLFKNIFGHPEWGRRRSEKSIWYINIYQLIKATVTRFGRLAGLGECNCIGNIQAENDHEKHGNKKKYSIYRDKIISIIIVSLQRDHYTQQNRHYR
jgi:hypothetical protein